MEGEVYLSEPDLIRIAQHLKLTPEAFATAFVIRTKRGNMRLRKPPDRQCHFHSDNRCSIHVVKPTQCRVFPYWPELIEHEEAWNETAGYCPGIGKGDLIQIEAATAIGEEMYSAYPAMYPEREPATSRKHPAP